MFIDHTYQRMWVARLAQEAVYELGAQLAGSLSGELMPNESTIEAYAEEALNLLMEWGPEKRTEWSNPRELDHGFTFERYLAINNRLYLFSLVTPCSKEIRQSFTMREAWTPSDQSFSMRPYQSSDGAIWKSLAMTFSAG